MQRSQKLWPLSAPKRVAFVVAAAVILCLPACTPSKIQVIQDGSLLPTVTVQRAWTAADILTLKQVSWAIPVVQAANQTGPAGAKGLLELFSATGVRVIDGSNKSRTIVGARGQSHPMWVQAGQVLALMTPQQRSGNLMLNDLLSFLDDFHVPGGPTASSPLLRAYFSDAVNRPVSPDEWAWRDVLLVHDTVENNLATALAGSSDYRLTGIQAELLLVRLRAELLQVAVYERRQLIGAKSAVAPAIDTVGVAPGGNANLTPETLPRELVHPVTDLTDALSGCSLDEMPGAVTDAWSLAAGKLFEWLIPMLKVVPEATVANIGYVAGIAGLVTTLLNLLATNVLFEHEISVSKNPVQRTKSRTVNNYETNVKVKFGLSGSGDTVASYINCARLITTAVPGLSFTAPEGGAWKGAKVIADSRNPSVAAWKSTGSSEIEASQKSTTGEDGSANFTLIGRAQPNEIPDSATSVDRRVFVYVSVYPETMDAWWKRALQYTADYAQSVIGAIAIGTTSGKILYADGIIKDLIHVLNVGGWYHASQVVTYHDWRIPYPDRVEVNADVLESGPMGSFVIPDYQVGTAQMTFTKAPACGDGPCEYTLSGFTPTHLAHGPWILTNSVACTTITVPPWDGPPDATLVLDATAKTLSWFFTAKKSLQDPVCPDGVAYGDYPEAFWAGSPSNSPAPPYPWTPGTASMVTHAADSTVLLSLPGGGVSAGTTETFTFIYPRP